LPSLYAIDAFDAFVRCKLSEVITNELLSVYAIIAVSFGLAPSGGIHMHFVKGRPPVAHYSTCPGARAKRREVALGLNLGA
jgi:hypothetical protein